MDPLSLNKSSPYSHMLFPTEPVNITLQSMSRPLSSLLVFLAKLYMLFSTFLLMLCIPYSLFPLVYKCTALPITAMTKFSVDKNVQVNSRSFWHWHIAIRVIFSLFCSLYHIQKDTHFRNWISSCPHAKGWKGTYSVRSGRKRHCLSMNNKQLLTSTHLPRFNICHLEMNKIIQITIKSCSFRHSWELPQFLITFTFYFRQLTIPASKRKYRGN